MIVYEVISDAFEEGCAYYTNKAEALRDARLGSAPYVVNKCEITHNLKGRALAVALLNGRQWAAQTDQIEEGEGRRSYGGDDD